MTDQIPAGAREAAARLARLSEEFFEVVHTTDPLNATQLGVSGFDALLPDPAMITGTYHQKRTVSRLNCPDMGMRK